MLLCDLSDLSLIEIIPADRIRTKHEVTERLLQRPAEPFCDRHVVTILQRRSTASGNRVASASRTIYLLVRP
jgi:hypothetical protein